MEPFISSTFVARQLSVGPSVQLLSLVFTVEICVFVHVGGDGAIYGGTWRSRGSLSACWLPQAHGGFGAAPADNQVIDVQTFVFILWARWCVKWSGRADRGDFRGI